MNIVLPPDFNPEQRGKAASDYFLQGYNCCQSVLLAFADVLESNSLASRELLSVIASGFGGGMARMREVCGSFSGMVCMAGFISPADNPQIKESRRDNYALVQEFAEEFKRRNGGSIVCRELLGLTERKAEDPTPSERTAEYYRKRPCPVIICNAARIVAEKMLALSQG